jgi:hypothetical protein
MVCMGEGFEQMASVRATTTIICLETASLSYYKRLSSSLVLLNCVSCSYGVENCMSSPHRMLMFFKRLAREAQTLDPAQKSVL